MGKTRVIAETGAGQHGVATATVCALLGLECVVYMGAEDMARQAPNVVRMRLLGAEVRGGGLAAARTLKDAINEAMRDWVTNVRTTHYLLGSVLGRASVPDDGARLPVRDRPRGARADPRGDGRLPDVLVACVGGGSQRDRPVPRVPRRSPWRWSVSRRAARRAARASTRRASSAKARRCGVLHGTRTYLLQDEAGNVLPTHSISAGLDYPAVGPEHALPPRRGPRRATTRPATTRRSRPSTCWRETEGIIPALESSHAVAWLLREAPALAGRTRDREPERPRRQGPATLLAASRPQ